MFHEKTSAVRIRTCCDLPSDRCLRRDADRAGTGTITVSAGERTVTIPVTVTGYTHTLQDFEGDFLDMGGSPTARIEPENRSAYIRFGRQK